MRARLSLLPLIIAFLSPLALAQPYVSIEGGLSWQSRNDQRVPGDGGTGFSISEFEQGPFPTYRIYAGYVWDERHELRGLYAPLSFEVDGELDRTTAFNGTTFAADVPTQAYYKFNSYRLTYAYHLDAVGAWHLALGFTAKVRDAEVRLQQEGLRQSKANVGFVPLVNFQAMRELSEAWRLRFDLDALAAPQGRAIDAALFVERDIAERVHGFGGYRMVEGGADNDKVYNFAWFHTAVAGVRASF